ncbi:cytochrome C oxidase subunit IV [Amylibacter kogurei]|uniref:Cytochrome C oxidase subunit IV n=1 Tax=Paramylibacter kogurei TaxID=1889778 RepID=A0A2G5KAW7_9RHOB|nr:aa3-type cytochrome c oxidase subunit IV [Amylibacter kogurei]PIB26202.1 cytochrome C oxidase subunit IV [Amylibacter kogurei]
MAEKHKHGSMDISAQEAAFDGFIKWSIRISGFSIGCLIFMALFTS